MEIKFKEFENEKEPPPAYHPSGGSHYVEVTRKPVRKVRPILYAILDTYSTSHKTRSGQRNFRINVHSLFCKFY